MHDERFMKKALEAARQALHRGEFPVACVMAYKEDILVSGARRGTVNEDVNELDHAEMVALRQLTDLNTPAPRDRIMVYTTLEPCLMCYSALILNGIRSVVYAYEDVFGGGTNVDLRQLNPLYASMDVDIVPGILRDESLELLKAHFSDPGNRYLKGSMLARQVLQD
jgi:tRNA(adenine34) deaminase